MTAHPPQQPKHLCLAATNDNGVDSRPPPARGPALCAEALERVALQLAGSIIRLDVSGALDPRRAAECLRLSLRLVHAIARLPSHGADRDVSALDMLTTLLRLEVTLVQLQEALAPLHDARLRAAIRELEWRLAPLSGTYHAVREHLSRLEHGPAAVHG